MTALEEETISRIKSQLMLNPKGITISDLSHILKINRNIIAKYLQILLISGEAEMKIHGNAKVYSPSRRMPLTKILDSSSEKIILLDSNSNIIWLNDAVRSIIKEDPDGFIGIPLNATVDPFLQNLPYQVTSEPDEIITEINASINGELKYFRIRQTPTVLTNGEDGVILRCENITKEKKFKQLIELSEARFKAIVEDQTEFIIRFLPDGTITFVNETYASYAGRSSRELLGTPFILDLCDNDAILIKKHIRELCQERSFTNLKCKIRSENGFRYHQWTFRALFDDIGNIYEYQGIGCDITGQAEAEERLKQHAADLEFISRKAQEFLELSYEEDLYAAIAEGLSELLPDMHISVSSFDNHSEELTIRYACDNRVIDVFREITGRDLIGFRIPIDDPKVYGIMRQNNLHKVYGDIHGSLFSQVPYLECREIEERLNIGGVYVLGLASNGKILGSIAILTQKGGHIPNPELVKAYIQQSSLFLAWKKADECLYNNVRDWDFLSQKVKEFVGLPFEEDMYDAIGKAIHELLPGVYISVSSFDPSSSFSTVRFVAGDGVRETFREITGTDIYGLMYEINDRLAIESMNQSNLNLVPGGLYAGLFGMIPSQLCKEIEKRLNMDEIYVISLSLKDQIFGNVAILPKKGDSIPDPGYIETFINQVSLILGWRKVSAALFQSEERVLALSKETTEYIAGFLPDGSLTYINTAYENYLKETQNGLPCKERIPEITSYFIPDMLQEVGMKEHGKLRKSIKCSSKTRSGQVVWQQWDIRALLDQKGEISEFQCYGKDITEIHEAEEKNRRFMVEREFISRKISEFQALSSDEDIYHAIIQGLREIVPDCTITISSYDNDTNNIIAKGILPAEIGHLFRKLTGEDIIGKRLRFDDPYALKTTKSGKIIRIPGDLYFTMSGAVPLEIAREIELTFLMGRDKFFIGLVFQDRILAVVMIVPKEGEDLTSYELIETYIGQASLALSQRLAMEGMRESQEMLWSCIEAEADFIIRILSDGTLLYFNKGFCGTVKNEESNLAGRSFFSLIPDTDHNAVNRALKNATSQNPKVILRHRLICADGEIINVELTCHRISHNGNNIAKFFCLGKVLKPV